MFIILGNLYIAIETILITLRFHLTNVKMANIKKTTDNKTEDVGKGEPAFTAHRNANWSFYSGNHYKESSRG